MRLHINIYRDFFNTTDELIEFYYLLELAADLYICFASVCVCVCVCGLKSFVALFFFSFFDLLFYLSVAPELPMEHGV